MEGQMSLSDNLRTQLKLKIFYGRGQYHVGVGVLSICPFCGEAVTLENADMHEAMITKGHVRGLPNGELINSRYNCVIRHHESLGCSHTGGVGGDEAFEKSARYLVEWEGYELVHNWLLQSRILWPTVGKEALQRFDSLKLGE
jgi:hypothetical protein